MDDDEMSDTCLSVFKFVYHTHLPHAYASAIFSSVYRFSLFAAFLVFIGPEESPLFRVSNIFVSNFFYAH